MTPNGRWTMNLAAVMSLLALAAAASGQPKPRHGRYPFCDGARDMPDKMSIKGQADPALHRVAVHRPVYYRVDAPAGRYEVIVHYLDAGEANTGTFRVQCNGEATAPRVACYAPNKKHDVTTVEHKTTRGDVAVEAGEGLRIRFDYEIDWRKNHAVTAIEVIGEQLTLRINCGGKRDYTDSTGRLWKADRELAAPEAVINLDPDDTTGRWVEISAEILPKMIAAGVEPFAKWKGRFTGRMNGIFHDRSGRTYINFAALGLWVYEGPGGRMYRADGGKFLSVAKGWSLNPYGPGFVLFCSHGFGPRSEYQALSWDGETIETWPKDADVGAVDWQAEGKVKPIFSKPRHANGIEVTFDAGKSVKEIGEAKGIYNLGALGEGVWVYCTGSWSDDPEQGMFRSDDMGKTWKQVLKGINAKDGANCAAILSYENRAYWHTGKGLYKSTDRGETWKLIPDSPVFEYTLQPGKDDTHMLGLSRAGVYETLDQGRTWKKIAPAPPVQPDQMWIQSHNYYDFTWDHENDVIYASAPDVAWRWARP